MEGLFYPLTAAETKTVVHDALEEDHASEDVTTMATIVSGSSLTRGRSLPDVQESCAVLRWRSKPSGSAIRRCPSGRTCKTGQAVERGVTILFLNGTARGLLSAERVALNFMQHLSGIATLTAQYVNAVRGTHARILDTRKTIPGWRRLEKYAVRCGGGMNHRNDLAHAVLIKDNHIAALDGNIRLAIERVRAAAPAAGMRIEVECQNLDQVSMALKAGADIIMLDNMGLQDMREAVLLVGGRAVVEASGGINLQTVRGIAETGVDWISIGSLTHSSPALDLALDFDEPENL